MRIMHFAFGHADLAGATQCSALIGNAPPGLNPSGTRGGEAEERHGCEALGETAHDIGAITDPCVDDGGPGRAAGPSVSMAPWGVRRRWSSRAAGPLW